MRFGVFQGLTATTWEGVRELWLHLEVTGWDAACVTDHFMPNTPDKVGDAMERLKTVFMRRMDRTAEAAADTLLAGPAPALREKLARMREAGVDLVWVPTMFLPKDARPLLDRFMRDVAPALR